MRNTSSANWLIALIGIPLRVFYLIINVLIMDDPSVPIRKIVGIVILKRIFNESDERVVDRWKGNPYWQYFCGEVHFQHHWPFDPTGQIKYRKRMGESGMERILKVSSRSYK